MHTQTVLSNRKFTCFLLIILALVMASCTLRPNTPTYAFPQGELRACGPTLRLDIVSTESDRQKGLMGVETLPTNYGMLFVFRDDVQPAFWMKDTPISLEVVFMSKAGEIRAIIPMEPFSETVHTAPDILPYALELPQGWMATHGVTVGDSCQLVIPAGLNIE